MAHRSTWHGHHETGHFDFGGRTFSAGGASIDPESSRITVYPKRSNAGYVATTWGGEVVGPIALVRSWKQRDRGGRPVTIYAWRMKFHGRTFTGRNAGPEMILRLSHASARYERDRRRSRRARRSRRRSWRRR